MAPCPGASDSSDASCPSVPTRCRSPVVDTHCHLDVAARHSGLQPDEAIQWAAEAGVTRIVQVGCDVEGSPVGGRGRGHWEPWSRASPSIPTTRPGWPTHCRPPWPTSRSWPQHRGSAEWGRPVSTTTAPAIRTGTAGNGSPSPRHIGLATAYDKTLVIHDRDAHADILDVLDAEGPPDRIVMHCFSGDADFARACLDRGAFLSFAGTVTFTNARDAAGGAAGRPAGPDPHRDRRALSDADAVPRPAQRAPTSSRTPPVSWPRRAGRTSSGSATPWPTTPTPPSADPGRTPSWS